MNMMKNSRFRSFALWTATLILGVLPCRAAGPLSVQDDGGFFSDKAKADAVRIITDTAATLKKDVAVETFKEVPADVKQGVNLNDKAAAARMVDDWAHKQFQQKRVNGVYILLVKEPAYLRVEVGNDTLKQAFTPQDRDALKNLMVAKLKAKQYDAALADGVNFIAATIKSHQPSRAQGAAPVRSTQSAPAASSGFGWVLPVILIVVVGWVVMGIVRALFGGRGAAGTAGAPGGGGGGGFFQSMLGGMFGAAAGMWLFDQFGGHNSSAYGAQNDMRDGGDSGFSGQDTDSSGSGGFFGDDSSGGGGDGGGGGDFGGGGDSGGGGGGDF